MRSIFLWGKRKNLNNPVNPVEKNERLLSCYAMYGVEKWGVKPEKIKLFEYNLRNSSALCEKTAMAYRRDAKGSEGR